MSREVRLYLGSAKIYKKFSHFKWVLSGLTSPLYNPYHYMEWDELGISYIGSNGVMYGPAYWTFDSYVLDGVPYAPDYRMPEVLFDGERNTETSKFDATDFVSLELYIHTTSGEGISPDGVGLISSDNQSIYMGATPLNFILYGLDESTNEYVQLVSINSSNVDRHTNAVTEVQFEPQSDTIEVAKYLLAPVDLAKGTGLRYEFPGVNLLPMTTFTWPSMSNGCFTITDNNVNCFGINGFRELLYRTFTVDETSDYLFELDWTSQTGLTLAAPNDSYWNRFGIYIDTSLKVNFDGGYQGAMSQGIIMQRSDDTSVITKSQTATVSLVANTTYYLWLSYSILADGRNQNIDFTKLRLTKV